MGDRTARPQLFGSAYGKKQDAMNKNKIDMRLNVKARTGTTYIFLALKSPGQRKVNESTSSYESMFTK